MSAASGLAAAKNRRCKDGPIVKVQGKPVACAPNTSCSRTSAPPAAQSQSRSRSAPAATATAKSAGVQSAKDIAQLLAGRNARELANGMKIPAGPMTPMQIVQVHELRLLQLESDMTQIVQVIADASDAQAQLDAASASGSGSGSGSGFADIQSFDASASSACDPSACQDDLNELFGRCDETDNAVAALQTELQQTKSELQQTKADFFKVQTFAMEAHMLVTKLAAEVQRLQQQQLGQTTPATTTEAPSPTSISLNISDISPTFSVESMHC